MGNAAAQTANAPILRQTVTNKGWLEEEGVLSSQPEQLNNSIGSSEAAAVMGRDPQCSPLDLWHQKMGLLSQPQAVTPEDDCKISWTVIEPLVAAVYAKRTGQRVCRVNKVYQHVQYPWMGAAIRWEVASDEVRHLHCLQVPHEAVCQWAAGVPEHTRIDAMHMLAVTGAQAVDIAALMGGRSVQIFRIERDETLIERLIEAEARFWGYVERKRPPVNS